MDHGDYTAARALHEESLTLRRELGDRRGIAIALNNLSVIARDQADWKRAAALSRESVAVFRDLGDKQGVALSLVTLGAAEYHLGSHVEATSLHQQALALFSEFENRREIAECLEVLAMLADNNGFISHGTFLGAPLAFTELPAEVADAMARRSHSALWSVPDDQWRDVVEPAIARVRALGPEPLKRVKRERLLVLERR